MFGWHMLSWVVFEWHMLSWVVFGWHMFSRVVWAAFVKFGGVLKIIVFFVFFLGQKRRVLWSLTFRHPTLWIAGMIQPNYTMTIL